MQHKKGRPCLRTTHLPPPLAPGPSMLRSTPSVCCETRSMSAQRSTACGMGEGLCLPNDEERYRCAHRAWDMPAPVASLLCPPCPLRKRVPLTSCSRKDLCSHLQLPFDEVVHLRVVRPAHGRLGRRPHHLAASDAPLHVTHQRLELIPEANLPKHRSIRLWGQCELGELAAS